VAICYLLLLTRTAAWAAVTMLAAGLVAFIAMVAFRSAGSSGHGTGDCAVGALATSIPLFLLAFAGTYVAMAAMTAGNFSEPRTRTSAPYFTVTVSPTVGFGDVTAKTGAARLVVTGQMIVDLVTIRLAVKVIVASSQGSLSGPA
jgi:voltage-gated potassium channel